MNDPTLYQYCQKLIVFRNEDSEVLLARRAGEADYDQTYTFIGGKLETTDGELLTGMKREKDEEIGTQTRLRVCPFLSYNVYFKKQSGQHMIVPHYYAEYLDGDIVLSDEYDDYQWVTLSDLPAFEPKIKNIPDLATWALKLKLLTKPDDFQEI